MKSASRDDQTIRDFGDQWTHYGDNDGYYGSVELLGDMLGPLVSFDELRGARVVDIGSGTGRIVRMLLDAGVHSVLAVEPSVGVETLRRNVSAFGDRVEVMHARGDELPAGRDLDFAISIGVIQFHSRSAADARSGTRRAPAGGKAGHLGLRSRGKRSLCGGAVRVACGDDAPAALGAGGALSCADQCRGCLHRAVQAHRPSAAVARLSGEHAGASDAARADTDDLRPVEPELREVLPARRSGRNAAARRFRGCRVASPPRLQLDPPSVRDRPASRRVHETLCCKRSCDAHAEPPAAQIELRLNSLVPHYTP